MWHLSQKEDAFPGRASPEKASECFGAPSIVPEVGRGLSLPRFPVPYFYHLRELTEAPSSDPLRNEAKGCHAKFKRHFTLCS